MLLLICALISSQKTLSEIVQDSYKPALFYNTETFPEGIFDTSDNPSFSGKVFPHASLAWDLNNVVFSTTANTPKALWNLYQKYGLLKTMAFYQEVMKVISKKSAYKKAGDPRGFVWNALFYDIQNDEFRKILFETTIEANTLHKPIIDLLKDLTLNLHQNIVLSNMGQDILNLQIDRLEKQLTEPLSSNDLSSKQVDTFFILNFLKNPLNTVASQENGWLHKPDKASYETCLTKIKENKDTQNNLTIFIDDKRENVEAAVQNGLFDIAILYSNPEDLRDIFESLKLINVPSIRNFKEVQNLFSA